MAFSYHCGCCYCYSNYLLLWPTALLLYHLLPQNLGICPHHILADVLQFISTAALTMASIRRLRWVEQYNKLLRRETLTMHIQQTSCLHIEDVPAYDYHANSHCMAEPAPAVTSEHWVCQWLLPVPLLYAAVESLKGTTTIHNLYSHMVGSHARHKSSLSMPRRSPTGDQSPFWKMGDIQMAWHSPRCG